MDILRPNKIIICGNFNPLNTFLFNNLQNNNIESILIEITNLISDYENVINLKINEFKPTHFVYYNDILNSNTKLIFDYHLIIPLLITQLCQKNNIHFTYIGSGYIYKNDCNNNIFCENNEANNYDSPFLIAQSTFDKVTNIYYDIILNIKIKYPISFFNNDNFCNILQKLYINSAICSIPNSITIIDDFIPEIINWIMQYKIGKIYCVNSGKIDTTDIITLYAKYCNNLLIDNNDLHYKINGFDYKVVLNNTKLLTWWKECPSVIESIKNKFNIFYNK